MQNYMFEQGGYCLLYGNIAMLHVCTGIRTLCSTVTLHGYMLVQEMQLSAKR